MSTTLAISDFQMADSGPWSLGTLIWLPILALIVLVCVVAAVAAWRADEPGFSIGAVLVAFVFVGCTALPQIGMYPYKAEYHQWRDVSGTVDKIDRRLISKSDSMEDKFVIRFEDSNGAQFGCDDTRCASVEEGDALTLSCKRAWQYTGTDGYDCRFVSTEAP